MPRHFLATSSSSRRDVHAANLSRVLQTYTFGCRRGFFILTLAFLKYVPPREYRILGGEFFEALGGVFGGFVAPYKTSPTKVRRAFKIVAHTKTSPTKDCRPPNTVAHQVTAAHVKLSAQSRPLCRLPQRDVNEGMRISYDSAIPLSINSSCFDNMSFLFYRIRR